ncbi:MAG: hypothetical protein KBA66_03245 [Leptospiraceae bacterium]|nr:hypothetical protein [Leptospiraceae bacterium]
MGQSEIKREHLRLSETDFPILEEKTKELIHLILSSFSCETLKDDGFPYRYAIEKNSIRYEFIFSQMGSFTLRLAQSDRYRRNPPPIFYISIGKYENAAYVWEDFSASPVDVTKESLVLAIESSMKVYEDSTLDI